MRCAPVLPSTRLLGPSTERDPACSRLNSNAPSASFPRLTSAGQAGHRSVARAWRFRQRYLRVEEQPRPVFARLEPPKGPLDGRRDEDLEASFTGMDEDQRTGPAPILSSDCCSTRPLRYRTRSQPSASPPRWRWLERGAQPLGPRAGSAGSVDLSDENAIARAVTSPAAR